MKKIPRPVWQRVPTAICAFEHRGYDVRIELHVYVGINVNPSWFRISLDDQEVKFEWRDAQRLREIARLWSFRLDTDGEENPQFPPVLMRYVHRGIAIRNRERELKRQEMEAKYGPGNPVVAQLRAKSAAAKAAAQPVQS